MNKLFSHLYFNIVFSHCVRKFPSSIALCLILSFHDCTYANTYFGNLSNYSNNYLSATKPIVAKEDNRIPNEKPMNLTKPTQSTLRTDFGQSITKSDLSKNFSQPRRPESRS